MNQRFCKMERPLLRQDIACSQLLPSWSWHMEREWTDLPWIQIAESSSTRWKTFGFPEEGIYSVSTRRTTAALTNPSRNIWTWLKRGQEPWQHGTSVHWWLTFTTWVLIDHAFFDRFTRSNLPDASPRLSPYTSLSCAPNIHIYFKWILDPYQWRYIRVS